MKQLLLISLFFFFEKLAFCKSFIEIKGHVAEDIDISVRIIYGLGEARNLPTNKQHFLYKTFSKEQFVPIYLSIKNNNTNVTQQIVFVVSRNSKVNIIIEKFDSIPYGCGLKITGLQFQNEEDVFRKKIMPVQAEYNKFYKSEIAKISSISFNKEQIDSIRKAMKIKKAIYIKKIVGFVQDYKHSYFSLFVFKNIVLMPTYTLSFEKDEKQKIFELFEGYIKQTSLWKETQKLISLKKSIEIGQKARNFYFKTNTRNDYSLFELLDKKKVLLIFTGTFCGGCVQQIPIIRDIENRINNDKLQIIYVSLDKTEKEWLNTIKRRRYPGLQTCDISQFNNRKKISDLYNIELIPQVVLISQNQEILYNNIFVKDDDALTKLKNILQL